MGGAHEICSDKTGTLTEGQMSVQSVYTGMTVFSEASLDNFAKFETAEVLAHAAVLNSSS